jgi:hypothetical protein
MDTKAKNLVSKIVEEMDKELLLGAAYDCMTPQEKVKFEKKLEKIVEQACL